MERGFLIGDRVVCIAQLIPGGIWPGYGYEGTIININQIEKMAEIDWDKIPTSRLHWPFRIFKLFVPETNRGSVIYLKRR
jgi:hypothetical protein